MSKKKREKDIEAAYADDDEVTSYSAYISVCFNHNKKRKKNSFCHHTMLRNVENPKTHTMGI